VVVPTLAALLVSDEKALPVDPRKQEAGGVGVMQRMTDAVVRTVAGRPTAFFLAAVVAVVLTGLAYSRLEPHYRLADQVPDKEQALAATGRLDAKLTGANPMHAMIRWQGERSLYDPVTLSVMAEAHAIMEKGAGLGNVWSLDSLRRWLAEAGDDRVETVKHYVGILPEHLVRRFIAKDEKSVLVTARLPDVDASEILPVVEQLDGIRAAARPIRYGSSDGLPAIAARNSPSSSGSSLGPRRRHVHHLHLPRHRASLGAGGVASVMPSLFPIFATGAILWATSQGASSPPSSRWWRSRSRSTRPSTSQPLAEEERMGPNTTYEILMRTARRIGPRSFDDHRAGARPGRDDAVTCPRCGSSDSWRPCVSSPRSSGSSSSCPRC
jgi:hypothetical protein